MNATNERTGPRVLVRLLTLVGVLLVTLFVVAALVLAYAYLAPIPVPASSAHPVATYDQALRRVAQLKAADPANIEYPTLFLGTGSKTATAVVLFHGFTNNPRQWRVLAQEYARRGYNVYVPRMPQHGARDIMSGDLERLRLHDLTAFADQSIDIASGLGDHVEVVGISGGATLAAWTAQHRDAVTAVALIAPFFKPHSVPRWEMKPLYQITPYLPPIWLWWHPVEKASRLSPPYSYPRYPVAALAEYLAIADKVASDGSTRTTPLQQVTIITNGADEGVDNRVAVAEITKALKAHAKTWVQFEFPRNLGYKHDLISPEGDNKAKVAAIYATLRPYLGLPPAAASGTPAAQSTVP
jgi:pimeloyl-ACP methyl ester carboxylesterase